MLRLKRGVLAAAIVAALTAFSGGVSKAQGDLTLCWAAWDPANACR